RKRQIQPDAQIAGKQPFRFLVFADRFVIAAQLDQRRAEIRMRSCFAGTKLQKGTVRVNRSSVVARLLELPSALDNRHRIVAALGDALGLDPRRNEDCQEEKGANPEMIHWLSRSEFGGLRTCGALPVARFCACGT